MRLDNIELHAFFLEKEISHLFHANTIGTSITFIEQGGLLSRRFVEENGHYQSPQTSDAIDKVFDVWNDIFLDSVDIHKYFSRQNYYGPLSFQISVDFLLTEDFEIWITKDNPINWKKETKQEDRYFISVDQLRQGWDQYPRQKKMITLRNTISPSLFNFVNNVVIDDPRILLYGKPLFNQSVQGLKEAVSKNPVLKNKFKTRDCKTNCYCISNYLNQVQPSDLKRLFLPKN